MCALGQNLPLRVTAPSILDDEDEEDGGWWVVMQERGG